MRCDAGEVWVGCAFGNRAHVAPTLDVEIAVETEIRSPGVLNDPVGRLVTSNLVYPHIKSNSNHGMVDIKRTKPQATCGVIDTICVIPEFFLDLEANGKGTHGLQGANHVAFCTLSNVNRTSWDVGRVVLRDVPAAASVLGEVWVSRLGVKTTVISSGVREESISGFRT